MKVELTKIKGMHSKLIGQPEDEEDFFHKRDFFELTGGYFPLDLPLWMALLSVERDHDYFRAFFDVVGGQNSTFKGLSDRFAMGLMSAKFNTGESFHQISPDGLGYIVDKDGRALISIARGSYKDDVMKKQRPVRQISMGAGGAMPRSFDRESAEGFVKDIGYFNDVINLYLDSIYLGSKLQRPMGHRIVVYPDVSDVSF